MTQSQSCVLPSLGGSEPPREFPRGSQGRPWGLEGWSDPQSCVALMPCVEGTAAGPVVSGWKDRSPQSVGEFTSKQQFENVVGKALAGVAPKTSLWEVWVRPDPPLC